MQQIIYQLKATHLWGKRKRRIKDLSALQLMRHATNLLNFGGRSRAAGRLIYETLVKNPYQLDALICMGDFLAAGKSTDFPIDLNSLPGVILEYALENENQLSLEERTRVLTVRAKMMLRAGFAKQKDGMALEDRDYLNPDRIEVEEPAYYSYILASISNIGSLNTTFHLAHALLGVYAELVAYAAPTKKNIHPYDPSCFIRTPAYYQWLLSTPEALLHGYDERQKRMT